MFGGDRISRRSLLGVGGGLLAAAASGCALRKAEPTQAQSAIPHTALSPQAPSSLIVKATSVSFLVTGQIFRPVLELMPGSTAAVRWLDAQGDELATGVAPIIEFQNVARDESRTVMLVTAYSDVVTLNLGFNQSDDAGRHRLDSTYNKDAEGVVGIYGLNLLVGLRRFMAANTPLTGSLDFTGLSALEYIECFKAHVDAVQLQGCASLVRLCLEGNKLSQLDLNPVASSLRDLRAAVQQSGALTFEPLVAPLQNLYHFCVREQRVNGHPTAEQLPSCEELWNWSAGQTGAVPVPSRVRSLASAGNSYTSSDFTGHWNDSEVEGELDLRDSRLSTIHLQGCRGLRTLRLDGNTLNEEDVDGLVSEVASWGTRSGTLSLTGPAIATPSSKSTLPLTELRGRGWDVTVNGS